MTKREFDPSRAMGRQIAGLDRQELCAFCIRLCRSIRQEVGGHSYRGGIFPENISLDENGDIALGEGKRENWSAPELDYIAPELYWHGKCGPASDVYSVGLLLYYGVTGGRLPYEGESPNAQLSRMNGKDIPAPKAAGRQLGEIMERALRFREEARYQSLGELEVMLESCLDNKYLGGETSAKALFRKEDKDLSDVERMMLSIIAGGSKEEAPEETPVNPVEELPAEEAMEEILADSAPEKRPAQEEEDPFAFVREFFSEPAKPEEEEVAESSEEATETENKESEDVRVYEPTRREREEGVPILTVEKNPELAPVIPRAGRPGTVSYGQGPERDRQIAAEVRRRRKRPLLVVLILCALLIGTALIANELIRNGTIGVSSLPDREVSAPPVGENAPQMGADGTGSIVAPTADPLIPNQAVYYQVFKDDCSWIDAKAKAEELGGHLAVITSQEELNRVAEAVGAAGIPRAWIGCHRVDGNFYWETNEYVGFFSWDDNEPSQVDAYDGAPEDFVMLVNNGRWVYNDCRNDPVAELPDYYSGTMGYVVEFGIGE